MRKREGKDEEKMGKRWGKEVINSKKIFKHN